MRLGIISDTHGMFDDSVTSVFAGVDQIIHAGDIGKIEVISRLEEIAPVVAVEGNNDWFGTFPTERIEEFAGQRVMIRHIFGELHQIEEEDRRLVERLQPHVVIFGHSHRPYKEMLGRTMLFNPGSAGPRRFKLPRTVGIMTLDQSRAEAQIITLD